MKIWFSALAIFLLLSLVPWERRHPACTGDAGRMPACWALTIDRASAASGQDARAPSAGKIPALPGDQSLAQAAKDAGKLEQAVELYRQALGQNPSWVEGWWSLGTLLYDLDRYPDARDAFRKLIELQPKAGPALTLLGFCEFQTREYEKALLHLEKGGEAGVGDNAALRDAARYHSALLLNRIGQHEAAFARLRLLALDHAASLEIIEAFGIIVLRLTSLPGELPREKVDPVMLAGRAGAAEAANRMEEAAAEYSELATRFSREPNVHYARGAFQLATDPDAALKEFATELEISPSHVPARLQIALEHLKRGRFAAALPLAREAVALDPGSFVARNALGRALLESGAVEASIRELEYGVKLAPDSPDMQFSLVRAYVKANRKEDADRARAEAEKLYRQRREREELMAKP